MMLPGWSVDGPMVAGREDFAVGKVAILEALEESTGAAQLAMLNPVDDEMVQLMKSSIRVAIVKEARNS